MDWPADAFWDHALALYRRPGVEAACLKLQRRHGVDVNLLLLACWLSTRGIELDAARLDRVRRATAAWQDEVVRPLRAVRRRLGARLADPEPDSPGGRHPALATALRARLLALEVDAEHLGQLAMHQAVVVAPLAPTGSPGVALAWQNLARCGEFGKVDRSALSALLGATLPAVDPAAIGRCLSALDDSP